MSALVIVEKYHVIYYVHTNILSGETFNAVSIELNNHRK